MFRPAVTRGAHPGCIGAGSHGYGYGLHGELAAPGVEAPDQGHGLDTLPAKLLRRTGAGGFAGSSAIGHHQPAGRAFRRPRGYLIGQNAYATGDLITACFEAGPGPYVQHHRRVRLRQKAAQFFGADAGDLSVIVAK